MALPVVPSLYVIILMHKYCLNKNKLHNYSNEFDHLFFISKIDKQTHMGLTKLNIFVIIFTDIINFPMD